MTAAARDRAVRRSSRRAAKRCCGTNYFPRSTLVRRTLASYQREEKCLINPVGRSSPQSGGSSKMRIPSYTAEELFKRMEERG